MCCLREALGRAPAGDGDGARAERSALAAHCRALAAALDEHQASTQALVCSAHDDHTQKLSSDILSFILSHLSHRAVSTSAQVCRRWRRCAGSRAVWSRLYVDRAFCALPAGDGGGAPLRAEACRRQYCKERQLCWDDTWYASWQPSPSPYKGCRSVFQPEHTNLDNIFRALPAVRHGRWFWEVDLIFSRGVDGIGCALDMPWTAQEDHLAQDVANDDSDDDGDHDAGNGWPTEWFVPSPNAAWMWNTHGGVVDRELYLPAHPAYSAIQQEEWTPPHEVHWRFPQCRSVLRVELDADRRIMHLKVNGAHCHTWSGIAKDAPPGTPIYMFVLLFAGGGATLRAHGEW